MFAKSILENAVHAPSTANDAKEDIKLIFGDVSFSWDGTSRDDLADGNARYHLQVFRSLSCFEFSKPVVFFVHLLIKRLKIFTHSNYLIRSENFMNLEVCKLSLF